MQQEHQRSLLLDTVAGSGAAMRALGSAGTALACCCCQPLAASQGQNWTHQVRHLSMHQQEVAKLRQALAAGLIGLTAQQARGVAPQVAEEKWRLHPVQAQSAQVAALVAHWQPV